MDLKLLTDTQLINDTTTVVNAERRITAEAIKHLYEVNRRKLYLKMGYESLFTMLRKHWGYCEPTAHLRKNAVILMQDVPEVIKKIESGEMPVTVAANIQSFLYSEKRSDRGYSKEAKVELIETCTGKSVREVQREFVRRNPEIEKREVVRATDENHVRVCHSLSNETEAKIQRIRLLWSNAEPNMSREQVLDRMAELTLDQICPIRKAERSKLRKEKARTQQKHEHLSTRQKREDDEQTSPQECGSFVVDGLRAPEVERTRYVRQVVRDEVHSANPEHTCEFVDRKSGRRCESRFQLQLDHIVPFSHGGANEAENLRVFCGAHNQNAWETRAQIALR